ncbi:MAG: choice-of-anchor J domain-containing protein [Muribaculaceae bacterium]|nr:choice-of-anchor J domain-containing protein [Muribaculaceae bacterium]
MNKFSRRFTLVLGTMLLIGASEALGATPLLSFDFNDEAQGIEDFVVLDNSGSTYSSWVWNKYTVGSVPYYYAKCYEWQKSSYDDYLTTSEGVALQPGHAYRLSFDASSESSSQTPRLQVCYGTGDDPTTYTIAKEITPAYSNKYQAQPFTRYEVYFDVPDAGDYHISFHAVGNYGCGIDNIVLEDAGSPNTPTAPTSVNVAAASDFSLSAVISVVLPTKSITGADLTSIDAVKIMRGETLVATVTDNIPAPGETFTWTDTNAEEGINSYSVSVICGDLESEKISGSAFIGPLTPKAPTAASVTETAEGLLVKWTAPTKSVNDITLESSLLKYNVIRVTDDAETTVATDLVETEFTDNFNPASRTEVSYKIEAVYSNRTSEAVATGTLIVGNATLPFANSFAGQSLSNWNVEVINGTKSWEAKASTSSPSTSPQDNDGGFAWYNSYNATSNSSSRISTPTIATSSATNATVEFWFMHNSSGNDRMVLEVQKDGGEWVEVSGSELKVNGAPTGWTKYSFGIQSMIEGSSKFRVGFRAISAYGYNTSIDNVRIYNALTEDLVLAELNVPAAVVAGNEHEIKVLVRNQGAHTVAGDAYSVVVTRNGESLVSMEGAEIASGATSEFTHLFAFNANHAAEANHEFAAKVIYSLDEDNSNNEATVSVAVADSGKPVVPAVRVNHNENIVTIDWDPAVDAEGYVATNIEETFATAEDGEIIIEGEGADQITIRKGVAGIDWTPVDLDGKEVGARYGFTSGIWDYFHPNNSYAPKAQTGGKVIGVMCPKDKSDANDWLISPALNPYDKCNYQVEFDLLHMDTSGTLEINVMYTEDDFDLDTFSPDNFSLAQTIEIRKYYDQKWNRYTATVPGKAKHIALVNVCSGNVSNLILIDRISIKSDMDQVLGYNVYRNGSKHNEELIEGTSYQIDLTEEAPDMAPAMRAADRTETYHVTAHYPEGESALSDPVMVVISGVDDVYNGSYGVTVADGGIKVMEAAKIYSLDGRLVAMTSGEAFVALGSGTYLVKTATATVKVMIR